MLRDKDCTAGSQTIAILAIGIHPPVEQVLKREFQMVKPGLGSLTKALSHTFSANFMKKNESS